MSIAVNVNTRRARDARLGKSIGLTGYKIMLAISGLCAATAIALGFTASLKFALLLASPTIAFYMPAVWWKRYLSVLPAEGHDLNGRLSADVLARLKPGFQAEPQSVWAALSDHWQANFILNHLLISKEVASQKLSDQQTGLEQALQLATRFADESDCETIELGFVIAGLMLASPNMMAFLTKLKIRPEDVAAIATWLGRNLAQPAPSKHATGGIGRDWAFGYTPLLDQLGHNLSLTVASHGGYTWLTQSPGVKAIESAFNNHAHAVALIGQDGIGKTTHIGALAQLLIEGDTSRALAYHQVVSLNAGDILANAQREGELEQIMIHLANEAAHAGHIILFFDDAQLFFGGGPGSFDATRLLLPIIQGGAVPIILAMSPEDHQRLRTLNQSLANLLTPVVLHEMPEADIMRVLEDTALGLESQNHILVTYEALKEAYRLSGRYNQDEAYPGRAIKLLEQSVPHSEHSILSSVSVQKAIEQAYGVKVSSAVPAEADSLLHLEDAIHQRMINQSHAVSVVASALRRARAGVANPRRPIGSFLFLGPTGVGKTELAKAIAATYFNSESSMIRLDMSEYQQPEDVSRLLSDGKNETKSLIMQAREHPFSVILLDEIEKAHPNILNLLLQLLDEGQLTDTANKPASFKDSVIIATSNAGAQTIRERVQQGETLESFQAEFTDELINSGQFKPELLNRFDEIVLFRPLTPDELSQVVGLMVAEVNQTLAPQNISIELTAAATVKIVEAGYDPRLGARPMRRALQRAVENTIAQKILSGEAQAGDHLVLDVRDLQLEPAKAAPAGD